jgi:hypothetical protein
MSDTASIYATTPATSPNRAYSAQSKTEANSHIESLKDDEFLEVAILPSSVEVIELKEKIHKAADYSKCNGQVFLEGF